MPAVDTTWSAAVLGMECPTSYGRTRQRPRKPRSARVLVSRMFFEEENDNGTTVGGQLFYTRE